ncbi:hypothetical protein ACIBI9_11605 [Nonomuraea sp. NPDC050451]|uniref:hypothetical protein n=1 Tax=Nonomuraea sp. NPDC050451 TaxID=3364364 RepID=UPI0037B08ECC
MPDDQTSVHGLAQSEQSFDGGFQADGAISAPPTHSALLRRRNRAPYPRILLSAPATPKTDNNPVGMNVRSSFDEGATWRNYDNSTNRIDGDHAGCSDMALLGNGAIGVLYERTRPALNLP